MRQRKGSAYLDLLFLYEQRRREICSLVWIKSIGFVVLAHHLPWKHERNMVAGHLVYTGIRREVPQYGKQQPEYGGAHSTLVRQRKLPPDAIRDARVGAAPQLKTGELKYKRTAINGDFIWESHARPDHYHHTDKPFRLCWGFRDSHCISLTNPQAWHTKGGGEMLDWGVECTSSQERCS